MLGKIRRHHCKERFKISTMAKFGSNLLKANGDRAPELRNFSDVLSGWSQMLGGKFGAQFSQICGAIYILARVRRIQSTCHLQHLYLAMLPIGRRFFHHAVDRFSLTGPCQKLKKTVFRQRTSRSTIWTPGTGYGRVDWNRSWYPSLLSLRGSSTPATQGKDIQIQFSI